MLFAQSSILQTVAISAVQGESALTPDTASWWWGILVYPYLTVLFVLCVYGLHRYMLVHLYYRGRDNTPKLNACLPQLPQVTVQLPMYNEMYVARRIIEVVCAFDYPRDRLHVQVLDDSTDETADVARRTVREMRRLGFNIEYIHRDDRHGYKAGALQAGLKTSKGEFIAIFDADFIPPPDILKRTIHHFADPKVGMVQTRWDHVNRDRSLLTESQGILLDGHFVIEHGARNRSGRFMSFNGTAGVWRKSCIADAGGWHHDTLTEDMDLSYRAQLKGWRFVFLPDVVSPAELPPDMAGFRQQQARWAKGGAQTMLKLLPEVLRSKQPFRVKLEAFFHLTSCTVYLWMVLLTILLFPALYLKLSLFPEWGWRRATFDLSILALATCGASTFYLASQRELFRTWWGKIGYLPSLMALGIGISLNNAKAVIEALIGIRSEFVRTPKFGLSTAGDPRWRTRRRYAPQLQIQPWVELAIGIYFSGCFVFCIANGAVSVGLPFLALFAYGYLYVSLLTIHARWAGKNQLPAPIAPRGEVTAGGEVDPSF
jgi:cellulose synthase/poly-beta-1,6-N-acetylglucosamine synthase-like glycosyltransferase